MSPGRIETLLAFAAIAAFALFADFDRTRSGALVAPLGSDGTANNRRFLANANG